MQLNWESFGKLRLSVNLFRQVLEDMEMLSAFTSVLHVPNLSTPEHLLSVVEVAEIFSKDELQKLERKIRGHR